VNHGVTSSNNAVNGSEGKHFCQGCSQRTLKIRKLRRFGRNNVQRFEKLSNSIKEVKKTLFTETMTA